VSSRCHTCPDVGCCFPRLITADRLPTRSWGSTPGSATFLFLVCDTALIMFRSAYVLYVITPATNCRSALSTPATMYRSAHMMIDDDMLTPTGYPPSNTAAGTAHSAHSTQPAPPPHRTTPKGRKQYPASRSFMARRCRVVPRLRSTICRSALITPATVNMAATSFEHRGAQCLLILTRSTSPPPRSVPCVCVLVSPLNMNRL